MTERIGRTGLLAAIVAGAVLAPAAAAVAVTPGGGQDPVRALERAAHPLRSTEPGGHTADLRALGASIGDAKVVGLGEATHGSHEFFTMKERVFRHLVEKKGFRTFALEVSWPAGLEIDDYLRTGEGDVREVTKAALANSPWDREEFVSLIAWMRDHNRRNPGRMVHFIGDDVGAPKVSDAFFGRVTGYVERDHPDSLRRLDELYTGLRPIDDAFAYLRKPLAERQRLAAQARQALELVGGLEGKGTDAFELAVQNARSISQTATFLAFDLTDRASLPEAQRFRDQVMADNTAWWQRRTGGKVLVSAHNTHVAYVAANPALYPKTQGAYLRDALGEGYLPIGFTFGRGSFLATDGRLGGEWKKFTVGTAEHGMNEYTLDKVRHRDYYLDLRTAPAAARAWLDVARPTRGIGIAYPFPPENVALGRSFDVLVHLDAISEATHRRP
ncbi:erythromycin esterase family protein [Nonomuraea sp. NPDC050540]|uniref:erythromycin esterase family protein n=1 Tax=Nonomuraea sp. NPDC050540 TaxID=3364367 RepID=UPI0037A724E8